MGNIDTFPIQHFEQKDVSDRIQLSLRSDRNPSSFEKLILDSLNYFDKSEYNLSVVVAHSALEIYLEVYTREILQQKYSGNMVEEKMEKVWEGEKLHKKVRRIFYGNMDEKQLLQTEDSYRKFNRSRELRRLASHKDIILSVGNALEAIQNIFEFVAYLDDNRQSISSNFLSVY